ncbi:MAG: HD domain-containing phosphohydrolase [Planctomycetota bacterium]
MHARNQEPILLVDDSAELLQGLVRQHRKSFNLATATGGEEGLKLIEERGAFSVVVSDFQMPGMNGITFLGKVAEKWPDTVRIMLTGQADLTVAINAVNQGRIFRFLSKPCERDLFESVLDEALQQHRLTQAEKILLEQTVRGSIQVLADILSIVNPEAFGRATRVRNTVSQLVRRMNLENPWMYETAALLCQIGCVAIPGEILSMVAAGQPLNANQADIYRRHPMIARDLLANIPRLEPIAEMLALLNQPFSQEEKTSGAGAPGGVLLGSRVLTAALAFDDMVRRGLSRGSAVNALRKRAGAYDPKILAHLESVSLPGQGSTIQSLSLDDLKVGMVLDEKVTNKAGMLLVAEGQEISPSMLARLKNYCRVGAIEGAVRVRVAVDLCELAPVGARSDS